MAIDREGLNLGHGINLAQIAIRSFGKGAEVVSDFERNGRLQSLDRQVVNLRQQVGVANAQIGLEHEMRATGLEPDHANITRLERQVGKAQEQLRLVNQERANLRTQQTEVQEARLARRLDTKNLDRNVGAAVGGSFLAVATVMHGWSAHEAFQEGRSVLGAAQTAAAAGSAMCAVNAFARLVGPYSLERSMTMGKVGFGLAAAGTLVSLAATLND